MQKNLQERFKTGFAPPRFGRRGQRLAAPRQRTLLTKLQELIDPTVTSRTLVNEGAGFGAFAFWALFSSDQSFPLAATFAYSVYQFQSKRVKRDPEGPFLGGNAIVGAIMTTLLALAIGCGVMALVTAPLATMLERSARQVGGFITVAVMGLCGIYLK
jgi:ATP-dependent HslUV protease ATP-binding subunit HslU